MRSYFIYYFKLSAYSLSFIWTSMSVSQKRNVYYILYSLLLLHSFCIGLILYFSPHA